MNQLSMKLTENIYLSPNFQQIKTIINSLIACSLYYVVRNEAITRKFTLITLAVSKIVQTSFGVRLGNLVSS